jgi:hypothetical protein
VLSGKRATLQHGEYYVATVLLLAPTFLQRVFASEGSLTQRFAVSVVHVDVCSVSIQIPNIDVPFTALHVGRSIHSHQS